VGKQELAVKPLQIIGVALLVLGLISLAYQGITYTKTVKVLEVGPITATKEKKETIPLPPILGGAALVGGVVLLVAGARR
jgi:membrane-bound ClpP family serine protease